MQLMGASTNGLSRNPLKVKIPVRIWMFSPGIDTVDGLCYTNYVHRVYTYFSIRLLTEWSLVRIQLCPWGI